MIKDEVGKGVMYLYIQLISSMISGYIFYILLARIASPEVIGTFSLLVTVSEIFANITIIGIPDAVQRLFGKSFLQNKLTDAKLFIKISLVFIAVGIITSSLVIIFIRDWISDLFGIDVHLIIIVDLLIASYAIYTLFYSIIVAALKTKLLALIITISSIAKVTMATGLILIGGGVVGLSLGYTFFAQILSSILLAVVLLKLFQRSTGSTERDVSLRTASKNLLTGGVVMWIPVLITTLGIDLGTLILYKFYGPYQSGIYFVTVAISNGFSAVVFSIFAISLPVLSSMIDRRKRFAWQTIRLGSILVLPLSSSMIFYSRDIMQLIGDKYAEGSTSLQILLGSTFPMIIFAGIEALVFSYGQYRHTLVINLASSIPRTILYFTLVPIFGMTGVAMSYAIGSVIGFIASTFVAKRIKMVIFWRSLLIILTLPLCIAFVLSTLNVNYIIGIITTVIISYLLLIKLHIVTESDISYFIRLLPYQISKVLIKILIELKKIGGRFYR